MVNKGRGEGRTQLRTVTGLVVLYVAIALAAIVALGILSVVEPRVATIAAWVHATIVVVFAVILPLRLRAMGRGSRRALRAVGIIAAVLLLVNVIEVLIPGLFPAWMRVEMVVIAVIMAAIIGLIVWAAVVTSRAQAAA